MIVFGSVLLCLGATSRVQVLVNFLLLNYKEW